MEKKELKEKIYSKIDELPTLPTVVPKILSLTESSKSCSSDITTVITNDPALTSKILKIANSAYYGFSQKITDLNTAVTLLGFNMVKSLALSIGVLRSLPEGKKNAYFTPEDLWLHSIIVASIIQELGKKVDKKNLNESLFIIGLIHDIGKIVLDQFFFDKFHDALEYANKLQKLSLHAAEQAIIGIDHCEVASMLLKRWKFPDKIRNPIAFHHESELPEEVSAVDIALLRIANSLTQELFPVKEGNTISNVIYDGDLKLLKMEEKDLDDMKAYLESTKDEIRELFNALI